MIIFALCDLQNLENMTRQSYVNTLYICSLLSMLCDPCLKFAASIYFPEGKKLRIGIKTGWKFGSANSEQACSEIWVY